MDTEIKVITTRAEIPVTIDGKKCVLIELDGTGRDAYNDFNNTRLIFDKDGKVTGISSVAGMQAKLIALSLRDTNGALFDEKTINGWPSTALETLFQAAKKLSKIGDEKEVKEEAKKA